MSEWTLYNHAKILRLTPSSCRVPNDHSLARTLARSRTSRQAPRQFADPPFAGPYQKIRHDPLPRLLTSVGNRTGYNLNTGMKHL